MDQPKPARDVLLVGLGEVSETHRVVLERIPDITIVAGVDPVRTSPLSFRGGAVPVYANAHEAAPHHSPDLVVVATPTPTHRRVCDEVTTLFPDAGVLVEKPVASTLDDARTYSWIPVRRHHSRFFTTWRSLQKFAGGCNSRVQAPHGSVSRQHLSRFSPTRTRRISHLHGLGSGRAGLTRRSTRSASLIVSHRQPNVPPCGQSAPVPGLPMKAASPAELIMAIRYPQ